MESFLDKINSSGKDTVNSKLTEQFFGSPERLPQSALKELIFKYRYVHETIPFLASLYKVTPHALTVYFEKNNIQQVELDTEEALEDFQVFLAEEYEQLRLKVAGLQLLHSARTFDQAIAIEQNLISTIKEASDSLKEAEILDAQELSRLTNAHVKLLERQKLITEASEAPAKLLEKLDRILDDYEWEVNVIHSDKSPQENRVQEIEQDEAEI